MRRVWLVLILLVFGLVFEASVVAAAPIKPPKRIPNPCLSTHGQYYNANLFPIYEYRNQRLILKNWQTDQIVRELDSGLVTPSLRFVNWSPDCHYLAGMVGKGTQESIMIWDTVKGGRVAEFSDVGSRSHAFYWRPDSEQIVINTTIGTYLWTLASNSQVQLLNHAYDSYQVQWDQRRRELFLLPGYRGSQPPGLSIYNSDSGQLIAYLDNPAGANDVSLGFHIFGRNQIAVFTAISGVPDGSGVTLWDSRTRTNVQINAGTDGVTTPRRVALSPDGRYLVIVRHTVRVWDLDNLSAEIKNRVPIRTYLGPGFTVNNVNFVDNSTFEFTNNHSVVRMDVHTGLLLPVIPAAHA